MTDYCCFKYRPIDKRLLESLIQSVIYFPHRDQLNDPFDCNVDIARALDHAISSGSCRAPEVLKNFRDNETEVERFRENVAKLGVGSFSLTNSETLLWSHYANDHKGVVLRYDFPEVFLNDEDSILGVSAVSYEPNSISDWLIQNAHLYDEDNRTFIIELLKKMLMSKAPAWSYEQEARIVRPVSGVFEVPRNTLTHVLFGLQTSERDEQLVRHVIQKYYEGVRFGRAVRLSDDFGIGTVEI
jgi:hypothetical protein